MPDPSSSLAPFPWLDVAVIIGLVCLNGVFAMSELAIVSSRKARLKALAAAGRKGAQSALLLSAEPGRFLSTVQIGITLVGIVAGAYSGASLGRPVGDRLLMLGVPPAWAHERSEEHTSELQVTNAHLVCRLLLEKKNIK